MNKILVVDDEQGIRDLMRFLLEPKGFEIVTANDGLEALEAFKKDTYDVILLDIHMPRMNGLEALKAIKKIKPGQAVIITSSSSDPDFLAESEAKKTGVYTCLYKPFGIDEIMGIIERTSR